MKLKLYLSLVTAAVALLATPASSHALAARAQACPGASADLNPATIASASAATLCLINYERALHRLAPLHPNGALASAAANHARDMAARNYFSHNTLGGGSFISRIKAVRYVRPNGAWAVGENIGWGTGPMSTPAYIVASWMQSAQHRANVLNQGFREIGIGTGLGSGKGLYTADFGRSN
jgi:uncharacterized protein YkwD